MTDIKPCPFCGHQQKGRSYTSESMLGDRSRVKVICKCGASGPWFEYTTPSKGGNMSEAEKLWDTRT